jgi:hypothetical protein
MLPCLISLHCCAILFDNNGERPCLTPLLISLYAQISDCILALTELYSAFVFAHNLSLNSLILQFYSYYCNCLYDPSVWQIIMQN